MSFLTQKRYSFTLILQYLCLLFDIGVNSFSTFARSRPADLLVLFVLVDCLNINYLINKYTNLNIFNFQNSRLLSDNSLDNTFSKFLFNIYISSEYTVKNNHEKLSSYAISPINYIVYVEIITIILFI